MNAFDELINLPGLRRLFDLAWHTFGVNPALVSMDGQRVGSVQHFNRIFRRYENFSPTQWRAAAGR